MLRCGSRVALVALLLLLGAAGALRAAGVPEPTRTARPTDTAFPAPTATAVASATPAPVRKPLTNADIIKHVRAGTPPEVLKKLIESSEPAFNLDSDHVLELQQNQVPTDIQLAMFDRMEKIKQDLRMRVMLANESFRINNPDEFDRAVTQAVLLGSDAVPIVLNERLAAHNDRRCRVGWLKVFRQLRDTRALPEALRLLADRQEAVVRREAAMTVAVLHDEGTVPRLIEMLGEPGLPYDGVAMALGYLRDPRAREALLSLANGLEADEYDRAQAIWALSYIPDPALPALFRGLVTEDVSPLVRNAAGDALSRVRDREVALNLDALMAAFRQHPENRSQFVVHLGAFRMQKVIEFLIRSGLRDPDENVVNATWSVLQKLTGATTFGRSWDEWDTWWQRLGKNIPRPDDALLDLAATPPPAVATKPPPAAPVPTKPAAAAPPAAKGGVR